ncbi:MAG TPA: TonB-dependent receptor [Burkholderiales bacterium]|nr:TonB-dependent receptor [Burkholderiales bacterium]
MSEAVSERKGGRSAAGVVRSGAGALFASVLIAALCAVARAQAADERGLGELSLEQLANIEVTSVSRRPEKLQDAAASIYVITAEDIRRSGATTLPEALRLAPNLQVARVDSRTYAISARGFNNAIGNKLLVMIDGRTVYSPLFSGVFWDQQDVMLQDVERIEVISGPGAALWGANAVNGVINVITRSARDTQGALGVLQTGNTQGQYGFRYGGKIGETGAFRFYGKAEDYNRTELLNGSPVFNGWGRGQAGFRADWSTGDDSFTLQGDSYRGHGELSAVGQPTFSGTNLLGRWNRRFADGSGLRVQTYLDHASRDDILTFRDTMDTFDVEAQYGTPLGERQHLLVGGGQRIARDETLKSLLIQFIPANQNLRWTSLFAQDEIKLAERLKLTAGAKLESNIYTGWEFLPSARLAWKPDSRQLVWGALSRAVRAPARVDREFFFPGNPPFFIVGGPNFVSEVSNVFELGYRAQPTDVLSYSLTAFRSFHERLRSGALPPATVQNMIEGKSTGLEAWGSYQVTRRWRLSGGLTTLAQRLHTLPGSPDPTGPSALGNDPDYQWMLRSQLDLPAGWEFDVGVRRVAALPVPALPAYDAVDARLGWRANRQWSVSLTVQNGFDPWHPEFTSSGAAVNQIPRSAILSVEWRP